MMMKDKSAIKKAPPAFQFYATDVLASKQFRLMNFEERGLYITLLSECWVNHSVPADEGKLSKFLGVDEAKVKPLLTENVLDFFEIRNDQIQSPDLIKYRAELDLRREKQSEGGKKGQQLKKTKQRVLEGTLEGPRVEQSRIESSRDEKSLYDKGLHAWISDYDNS
jgi:uncharacterized protein YdaU (DUF1376 family)